MRKKIGGSHVAPLLSTMITLGMCGFTIGPAAYCEQFRVVEVQQTFYDPPPTTLQGWREEAPPDFEFRELSLDASPEMSTGR